MALFDFDVKTFFSRVWAHIQWGIFVLPNIIRTFKMRDRTVFVVCIVVVLLSVLAWFLFGAPGQVAKDTLVKIPQGSTLAQSAHILKEKGLVRFESVFIEAVRLKAGDRSVVAGEYSFKRAQNVFTIATRLSEGEYDLTPIRVTVLEGMTARAIADLLDKKLPDFDTEIFYKEAEPLEGRLFPDTYFFLPGQEVDLVLKAFENNFKQQMRSVQVSLAISKFGKPLDEVLTMASILEKEGSDTENRRIIAGILWRRIENNMLLQVDAAFGYIFAGSSYDLTKGDLTADSPYNTYTHKGLPPGPIGNPGIGAIMATVTPITTTYVYYLSDREGTFHYATTYAQHLQNRKKYIGN